MNKQRRQFEYYRAKVMQAEFLIEFASLKELLRYAENHHQKSIFLLPAHNGTPQCFAFSAKGGLLQHPTEGFESLEDFSDSILNGFPDAATFYAAAKLGFTKFSEYKMSTETGIADAKAYDELRKEGYIEFYPAFEKERSENDKLPRLENITSAYELQCWIKENGFEGLKEFTEAWHCGFTDVLEFRTATTQGYKIHQDYKAAMAGGFRHSVDFYIAQAKGIQQAEEYSQYVNFEGMHLPEVPHDLKILLVFLSKLPDGKRTSLTKLHDQWLKEVNNYRNSKGELPNWFTTSISTSDEFAQALSTHEAIKKYGVYDSDGEFFETKKLKDRMIIVDGSNVAHGSPGKHREKPTVRNMLLMVNYLKAKGFNDITVFSDAALKHRLEEAELLKEIKAVCTYRETPPETTADLFLIAFVKRHHCLIVSNDTFREWKMSDSWVAENMDYYRLSFLINGDEVIMPDLEGA